LYNKSKLSLLLHKGTQRSRKGAQSEILFHSQRGRETFCSVFLVLQSKEPGYFSQYYSSPKNL